MNMSMSFPTSNSKFSPDDPSDSILSRRPKKVHAHRLTRSSKLMKEAKEKSRAGRLKRMEIKNMKLYLMNQMIVEENEKLRRKAVILLQEKKTLISEYQNLCNPK